MSAPTPGRPVVLLDCDDVVAQCTQRMLQDAQEILKRPIHEDELKTWGFPDNFEGEEGAQVRQHVYAQMAKPGWCLSLEPFPEAVEGVKKLRQISNVFFVTSPFHSPTWEYERRAWLLNHFGILSSYVIQVSAKFLVQGDVFVDDRPDNVRLWQDANPRGQGLLWEYAHNRQHRGPFQSIGSWEALYSRVLSHAPHEGHEASDLGNP